MVLVLKGGAGTLGKAFLINLSSKLAKISLGIEHEH